jgi:hypothetical protein
MVIHELVKFVGLLLVAQVFVFALSFGRHERNVVYRGIRFLTSPATRLVRLITPRIVVDKHIPLVTFLIMFWAWVALIFVRREFVAPGAAG